MQRATDRPYGAPLSAAGLKERLYTTQHQTQTRHQEQAQREFVAMRVTCCNTHLSLHWQIQSQRGAYFYITTAQYNVHKVFQDTYTKSEPSTQKDCSAANTPELCNVHAECSEVMCQRPTQTHSASLYQPNNRHLLPLRYIQYCVIIMMRSRNSCIRTMCLLVHVVCRFRQNI
jgi:hypothetical protein